MQSPLRRHTMAWEAQDVLNDVQCREVLEVCNAVAKDTALIPTLSGKLQWSPIWLLIFRHLHSPAVMILLRYAECFARRWWDHTVPAIGGMVGTHLDGHLALGRPCLNRTFASSDSGSKVAKYAKCCKTINKSPLGLNKTDQ